MDSHKSTTPQPSHASPRRKDLTNQRFGRLIVLAMDWSRRRTRAPTTVQRHRAPRHAVADIDHVRVDGMRDRPECRVLPRDRAPMARGDAVPST